MEPYPLDLEYVVDPARDERLAKELTAIRERGIENLYAPTGGQQPKSFPELQPRADAFCQALRLPTFGPTATMYALLKAAISAYARWGNVSQSQLLFLLFFDPKGTPHRSPGERLDAARTAAKLDEKRFYEKQRSLFRALAPFLDAFVTATIRAAATQLPPPEQDQEHTGERAEAHDAEHAETATPPPQGSPFSALLALVLAAGLVATILVLALLRPVTSASANRSPATPTTITSYAKCWPDASKPVVGVWIVADNGGSGWADWHTLPGQANVAWFSRTLPNGGNYVVHVGCGGTPAHWELALTSVSEVLGSGYTFTCYDVPSVEDPTQARCQP